MAIPAALPSVAVPQPQVNENAMLTARFESVRSEQFFPNVAKAIRAVSPSLLTVSLLLRSDADIRASKRRYQPLAAENIPSPPPLPNSPTEAIKGTSPIMAAIVEPPADFG